MMEVEVTIGAGAMTCKAPVKSSPSINQHPAFDRLDALPVAQPTVLKHNNNNTNICKVQNIITKS